MDTREVIDAYFDTINTGRWYAGLTLFDDHIVVDEQLAGRLEGINAWRERIESMVTGFARFQMLPQEIVVDGDKATVIWRCIAESADGGMIDTSGANFFRVKNSKIIYMANFHDKKAFSPFTKFMALPPDERMQTAFAARLAAIRKTERAQYASV